MGDGAAERSLFFGCWRVMSAGTATIYFCSTTGSGSSRAKLGESIGAQKAGIGVAFPSPLPPHTPLPPFLSTPLSASPSSLVLLALPSPSLLDALLPPLHPTHPWQTRVDPRALVAPVPSGVAGLEEAYDAVELAGVVSLADLLSAVSSASMGVAVVSPADIRWPHRGSLGFALAADDADGGLVETSVEVSARSPHDFALALMAGLCAAPSWEPVPGFDPCALPRASVRLHGGGPPEEIAVAPGTLDGVDPDVVGRLVEYFDALRSSLDHGQGAGVESATLEELRAIIELMDGRFYIRLGASIFALDLVHPYITLPIQRVSVGGLASGGQEDAGEGMSETLMETTESRVVKASSSAASVGSAAAPSLSIMVVGLFAVVLSFGIFTVLSSRSTPRPRARR